MGENDSKKKDSGGYFWGVFLIVLGGVFLLDELGYLGKLGFRGVGDFFSTFWPVILIVIGLEMLIKKRRQSDPGNQNSE